MECPGLLLLHPALLPERLSVEKSVVFEMLRAKLRVLPEIGTKSTNVRGGAVLGVEMLVYLRLGLASREHLLE